nr:hypothetical protein BaRGS_029842 [Batillaria attramentaria]
MTKFAAAAHLSETGEIGGVASSWHHTDKPEKQTAAEQAVRDMDIPEHLVRLAVKTHLLETGERFTNVQQLYLAALEIAESPEKQATLARKLHLAEVSGRLPQRLSAKVEEDGAEPSHNTEGVQTIRDAVNDATPKIRITDSCDNKTSANPTTKQSELRDKVRALTEENQKLARRKKCRVCQKVELATSGITFLPCGHFITCEDCAEKCDDCPGCGKNVMGTVRTFLS